MYSESDDVDSYLFTFVQICNLSLIFSIILYCTTKKNTQFLSLSTGSKDAACDIRWLKQCSITHILTIDSCPLPNKITDLPFVTTKYLQGMPY